MRRASCRTRYNEHVISICPACENAFSPGRSDSERAFGEARRDLLRSTIRESAAKTDARSSRTCARDHPPPPIPRSSPDNRGEGNFLRSPRGVCDLTRTSRYERRDRLARVLLASFRRNWMNRSKDKVRRARFCARRRALEMGVRTVITAARRKGRFHRKMATGERDRERGG